MKRIIASMMAAGMLSLFGGTYGLDMSHSNVGFSIKHMMVSNVKGKFEIYEGNIEFDEKTMQFIKLKGVVDADSVNTGIEKRDDHLRSADFFDVVKYPEIVFEMTSYKGNVEGGTMQGNLTIHGVTKPVTMAVEIGGVATDPWGGTRLGFSMETKINRKDFGLEWNKALEAGGFLVGEEVKLQIDIEGIKE